MLRSRTSVAMARLMTEEELLTAITDAATYLGWRWHHIRRSDAAIQQGHSGFPDLVLARDGRVIFLELKTMLGSATPDQEAWLLELRGGPTVSVRLVRPADLDSVLVELGARIIGRDDG